jgi:hypothetical protein
MPRRRVTHTTSLKERIAERAKAIATKAGTLPLGSKERDRMERRARQASTGSDINELLMSRGIRPFEQFHLATNSHDHREEDFVTQSNMPSRNLATSEGEPIQQRRSSRPKAAEIDLMRKNASEIYEIVFSADFAENPERNK